jgi:hypothetical protein
MPALPLGAAVPALAVDPLAPVIGGVVEARPAVPLGAALPERPALGVVGGVALLPALGVVFGDSVLAGGSAPHAAMSKARNITECDARYLSIQAG